jgi:hypothetical protein
METRKGTRDSTCLEAVSKLGKVQFHSWESSLKERESESYISCGIVEL